MSYCSERVSRKIVVLSFCAMVTVLSIHSDPLALMQVGPIPKATSCVLSWFRMWAIPFFYLVSGFFFSRYLSMHEDFSYGAFMRKKWRGLVIPYFCWGAIYGTLLYIPLYALVNHGHGAPLLKGTPLAAATIPLMVDHILGILNDSPTNGALWYVRMIVIFFAFAPIWRFIQRHCDWVFLIVGLPLAVGCGVIGDKHDQVASIFGLPVFIKYGAVGYLFLGMWSSIHKMEERRGNWVLVAIAAVLGVVVVNEAPRQFFAAPFFTVFFWSLYDCVPWHLPTRLPWIFSLSFWIYCMHHPLCGYAGAGLRMALGKRGDLIYFLILIAAPCGVMAIAWVTAWLVKRLTPRLFNVLNGGR